jgi:hypothetical protein
VSVAWIVASAPRIAARVDRGERVVHMSRWEEIMHWGDVRGGQATRAMFHGGFPSYLSGSFVVLDGFVHGLD